MSSSSEDDSSESSVGEVVEVEDPPLKKAEDGEVVEVEAPTNLKKAEDVKNSSRRFSLSSDTDTETGSDNDSHAEYPTARDTRRAWRKFSRSAKFEDVPQPEIHYQNVQENLDGVQLSCKGNEKIKHILNAIKASIPHLGFTMRKQREKTEAMKTRVREFFKHAAERLIENSEREDGLKNRLTYLNKPPKILSHL